MPELVRQPGIGCHVRQHLRAAEETGIGGDEQQPRLEHEHQQERAMAQAAGHPEAVDDLPEYDGVQRLPFDRLHPPEQVEKDDAAGGERQRGRHVKHRQLAGAHPRFPERLDVVRYRLDPGVSTAAQRVRAQEQRQRGDPADVLRELARILDRVGHDARQPLGMAEDAVRDQERMRDEKTEKNRQQDLDRFLHAAQIHHQQHRDERQLGTELEHAG